MKLIVGVAVCVFVFTMVLLTIGMLYRRYKDKPRQNYLVDKMEEDMDVSDSL